MKKLFFLLIIVILGILQVTIINYFKIFGVGPDLLLISAVIASLVFELRWAFILSVFAGFFKDIFVATGFGINTLMFALWCYLIVKLSGEISIDDNFMRMALMLVIALLHNVITGLIFIYLGSIVPLGLFLRIVFIGAIYTAVVMPLVFKISQKISYAVKRI